MIEPDHAAVLEAVAHFLESDLKGAVKEPALAFRTLIAAHLLKCAAIEARRGDTGPPILGDAELARRLRTGDEAPEAPLEAMLDALARELEIVSPRFDLRRDIEPSVTEGLA